VQSQAQLDAETIQREKNERLKQAHAQLVEREAEERARIHKQIVNKMSNKNGQGITNAAQIEQILQKSQQAFTKAK
jgi:hypothetical protein